MKCKDCDGRKLGYFKSQPDKHVCISVKEPFIIENINHECTEYPERRNNEKPVEDGFTVVLCGASASGKTTIQDYLAEHLGYKKITTYTTRERRESEVQDQDYHFISNEEFEHLIGEGFFAEYEEYSQGRMYGSAKCDYGNGNNVIVLTPHGIRSIKKNLNISDNVITVYVDTNLGNRVIRYIERIGADNFNFDDKNEISARVERDFGMFLGIEDEVDLIVDGNKSIEQIVRAITSEVYRRVVAKEDAKWS